MNREYHRWYSHRLGRDMELVVFGHGGAPYIVFPTSMGSFHEYEDNGMIGALAGKLAHGGLQLFCVSTVDSESWYAHHAHPRHRVERALAYEQYLLHELVPLVQQKNPHAIGVTGCSFGAYHALLAALRRPDLFRQCVVMGGAYDIRRFLGAYYDEDCYFLNPVDFLPHLNDPWLLDRMRANKWVLVTGDRDICLDDNRRMAEMLHAKGVPAHLHVWTDSEHDWPQWREMAKAYLP